MGAALSSPGLSRIEVKNVVEESIAPVRNTSDTIDSKLNTVVEKITDQILDLKDYIAKEKMKNVADLENKIRKASVSSDPASLDQIRELEEALAEARAEAFNTKQEINRARRERNTIASAKSQSNANLTAAKKTAANAEAAIQSEKDASAKAIQLAKEAANTERAAYMASSEEEKRSFTEKAEKLRLNAESAKQNAEIARGEKNAAILAKGETEKALRDEREAKEAAKQAEQTVKDLLDTLQTSTKEEKVALQKKIENAQAIANTKQQEALMAKEAAEKARANANAAKANANAARGEKNAAKLALEQAQSNLSTAKQSVTNAQAAADKAKENANAAVGEEKQRLKMVAEKALRNLQTARSEAASMAGKLANAEAQTGKLEANLFRAASEKTKELERRVALESKLSEYNKRFPALQSPSRSTIHLNMAPTSSPKSSKPSWNPSIKVRGGKRKTHARRSHGKHRLTKKRY
jgi:hypothetical protein